MQLTTPQAMRGRVLALWSMAFMGSAPIGGPIVGWIGEHVGARWGMHVGGIAPMLVVLWARPALARLPGGLDREQLMFGTAVPEGPAADAEA